MKKYLLLLTLLCCSCSNEVYEYEYIYENVDVNAYEIRFELNENEYQKFSYNSSLSSLENQELLKQYIENRNIYYTQMESKYNYIISDEILKEYILTTPCDNYNVFIMMLIPTNKYNQTLKTHINNYENDDNVKKIVSLKQQYYETIFNVNPKYYGLDESHQISNPVYIEVSKKYEDELIFTSFEQLNKAIEDNLKNQTNKDQRLNNNGLKVYDETYFENNNLIITRSFCENNAEILSVGSYVKDNTLYVFPKIGKILKANNSTNNYVFIIETSKVNIDNIIIK